MSTKKITFRVKWKAVVNEKITEGIEEESSWFLIDQNGNFFSYGPMQPIRPCLGYQELTPLIKIGDEYLTIDEIEKRLGKKNECK